MVFSVFAVSLHVPGRIFFYLVEDPKDWSFAFMVTYFPESAKKSHYSLIFALGEYRGDTKKMLSLLSDLNKVAENSEFISGLMDSGELFCP